MSTHICLQRRESFSRWRGHPNLCPETEKGRGCSVGPSLEHVCRHIRKWLAGPNLDPEAKRPGHRWAPGATDVTFACSECSFTSIHLVAVYGVVWKGYACRQ